jgi:hypothetical protein
MNKALEAVIVLFRLLLETLTYSSSLRFSFPLPPGGRWRGGLSDSSNRLSQTHLRVPHGQADS